MNENCCLNQEKKDNPLIMAEANGPVIPLARIGEPVIAVLQRGHVAVGIYGQNGDIGGLSKAAIVRRWGTTEGLGELAVKGPLPESRLDKSPKLSFHIREVIFAMEVSADAWRSYFDKY